MSQAGILSISSDPDVPLSFGVDFDSMGGTDGTVIANNNKVYVLGNPPLPVGTNGIVTQAFQTDAPNDTIHVKFIEGDVVTSDGGGQTQSIITIQTATNAGFTFTALFSARESATGLVFGGRLVIIGVNNADTVTIAAELEKVSGGDGALSGCTFGVSAAGPNFSLTVTGVAGRTINWTAIMPGIVGTA